MVDLPSPDRTHLPPDDPSLAPVRPARDHDRDRHAGRRRRDPVGLGERTRGSGAGARRLAVLFVIWGTIAWCATASCDAGETASAPLSSDAPAAPSAPAPAPAPPAPATAFGPELAASLRDAFDPDRAFRDLVAQVEIGARHPGSPGAAAFVAWLEDELLTIGLSPRRQDFSAVDPLTRRPLPGVNVLASWRPESPRLVLLSCHWDSRRWADEDPDPARRRDPVPAANDGASGVAVLLEVARVLASRPDVPPGLGVEFVFFDFEDQGIERQPETFALGALAYAERFTRHADVVAAINVDLIGDAELLIPIEANSHRHARRIVDDVWSHGRRLHPLNFSDEVGIAVFDDHIRLQRIGLPAINLIDFTYPPWHTTADTPDACSPESLRAVGRTLLSYLGMGARAAAP